MYADNGEVLINAFDMPERQAFLVEMIEDRKDLGNAIAINSSMVNLARLIGRSLAGFIIAASSEGWCFLIDRVGYLAVIASLLLMRLNVAHARRKVTSTFDQLKEGRGLRHDARNGGEQHDHPDHRQRRQARPRHGLVHHGVCGDGPVWQPAGGRDGPRAIGAPLTVILNGCAVILGAGWFAT